MLAQQGSARSDMEFCDWEQDWSPLSLNIKTETEAERISVLVSRQRLGLFDSHYQEQFQEAVEQITPSQICP